VLNNGGQETYFFAGVGGLPQNLDSLYGLEEVYIDLYHPAADELHCYLISPSGTRVELTSVLSCSGADFSNTTFNNSAGVSVTMAGPPRNGTFRPTGNLGRFNTNVSGNGTWKLVIKDFVAGPNAGNLVDWKLKFSWNPAKPVFLSSSNLPLVIINTPNSQPLDGNEMLVDLGIIDNGTSRNYVSDPWNGYSGKAKMHIRGSSSKMFEKNNLKVELTDQAGTTQVSVPLLGMPAESDWVLTAGYSDKSLMRNALTHYLFQQMGHYSPRYKFVEVVINGEYSGVYTLMETIKRTPTRVNIDKMTTTDNTWPYVSGGYIIQINRTTDPGWYSMYPGVSGLNTNFYYKYEYPAATVITQQQKNYLKAYLDSFEIVMNSTNFSNPSTGYRKYINDDSFIDFFILNEFSKNVDGYRLSTYMYKDNLFDGGRLHAGPMWDYDLAWHNCKFGNTFDPQFWQYQQPNNENPIPTWWGKFVQDPIFKDKLYCRWHSLRQHLLSDNNLYSFIDGLALYLDEAQKRNFRQFPILGAYIYPNPQNQWSATYGSEVADLKDWLDDRADWLDSHMPGFCNNVEVTEAFAAAELNAYPNPFSGSLSVNLENFKGATIELELTDMLGQTVYHGENLVVSNQAAVIETENLVSGTYFLKVQSEGQRAFRKVIKL
jgi:hypothetical protein